MATCSGGHRSPHPDSSGLRGNLRLRANSYRARAPPERSAGPPARSHGGMGGYITRPRARVHQLGALPSSRGTPSPIPHDRQDPRHCSSGHRLAQWVGVLRTVRPPEGGADRERFAATDRLLRAVARFSADAELGRRRGRGRSDGGGDRRLPQPGGLPLAIVPRGPVHPGAGQGAGLPVGLSQRRRLAELLSADEWWGRDLADELGLRGCE
jgi:hypothetical protein